MSRHDSPMERLGSELEAAAVRQVEQHAQAPRAVRRRSWWAHRSLFAVLVLGAGSVGAVAVAATALLRHGDPVPLRGGAPIAGRSEGAPARGGVRFLITTVKDPDGGLPWAMRYWTTDRGYACFQVGRYDRGHVGLVTGSPGRRVFHPLEVGTSKDGVSGCFPADAAGHARIAIHQSTAAGGSSMTACQDNVMTGDGHGRIVTARFPPGCRMPSRTVDVGLLGPAARALQVSAGGKRRTLTPIGPEGAYLLVQRYVKPVYREFGFQHKDPKLNLRGGPAEQWIALTPAARTIREVAYADGVCRVHAFRATSGDCLSHAAWAKLVPVWVGDVRAPVRAWAVDNKRVRVRFVARQTVTDRRSGYSVSLIPEPRTRVPGHGFVTYSYDHDIKAGQTARMTISTNGYPPGRFTIRVQFRTARTTPSLGEFAPFQPGPVVGTTHVTVRP